MQTSKPSTIYSSLSNRVVLVTGGASGIGAAVVEAFSRQSASVIFLDVQDHAAGSLKRSIEAEGGKAPTYYRCDLTDTNNLPGNDCDGDGEVRKNRCAGEQCGQRYPPQHRIGDIGVLEMRCIAINLKQQFFACQAVIPKMREARYGSIINNSRFDRMDYTVGRDVGAYVTFEGGDRGYDHGRWLMRALAATIFASTAVYPARFPHESAERLAGSRRSMKRRSCIARHSKRLITPDEVANLSLFLAS